VRVLFVNTGILGHASVARLVRRALEGQPGIEAAHLDLSTGLAWGERVVRRAMTLGPRPGTPAGALTAARFRHELHAGVAAARRIAALEARGARFDVIHFHPQPAAWGSLRRMRSTPCIVSIDATQRLAAAEAPGRLRRLEHAPGARRDAAVFRRAAAIVSPSRWAARAVADELPECAPRVHVLPYPVDLERFGAGWAHERAARPSAGPVRALFVGGDFARKGGPELLRAWEAGGFAGRAELVLVTDAPLDADALPAGVRVRRGVRAYTAEWLELWRHSDLFVMPSRDEAFGMVFQEAAAAGLPAVGTALNAIPEIVADGETGLLVPPGDVAALARGLDALVGSPALRARMGAAARRRIERGGSLAAYGGALADLVRRVAAERRG
jgi:glycosyltransferase involved in cell wall biosynthesis